MSAVAHDAAATEAALALPAASSSFYLAMRILPRERREAMYAIYAFCRAVDDLADEAGLRDMRRSALNAWRIAIDRMAAGEATALTASLIGPTRRFGLRREDFHAVIDGMQMDLDGDIVAPTWSTLDLYCDRVASAVGRLSVRIFGIDAPQGEALAHHLGRALQLTNILRDLDEDAAIGRLYLPREALEAAGVGIEYRTPAAIVGDAKIDGACRNVAGRAAEHYREANRIMARCPRRQVRAPKLMEAAYSRILAAMQAEGWAAPRRRVRISKLRLIGTVLRHGIV